jgi:TM2 domain-containing membrane protein YozV
MLSPGLGQMYNGQLKKGIYCFLGFQIISLLGLYFLVAYTLNQLLNILFSVILLSAYLVLPTEAAIQSNKIRVALNIPKLHDIC